MALASNTKEWTGLDGVVGAADDDDRVCVVVAGMVGAGS